MGRSSTVAPLDAPPLPSSVRQGKQVRLFPLDALRGLIILLMALDYANHFITQQRFPGEYWEGSFPAYRDALAFLTRPVVHLAAPVVFLLMGTRIVLFDDSRLNGPGMTTLQE